MSSKESIAKFINTKIHFLNSEAKHDIIKILYKSIIKKGTMKQKPSGVYIRTESISIDKLKKVKNFIINQLNN